MKLIVKAIILLNIAGFSIGMKQSEKASSEHLGSRAIQRRYTDLEYARRAVLTNSLDVNRDRKPTPESLKEFYQRQVLAELLKKSA